MFARKAMEQMRGYSATAVPVSVPCGGPVTRGTAGRPDECRLDALDQERATLLS